VSRRRRTTQAFPVLPCVGETGTDAFAKNLAFKLSEDREQAGHRSTSGRGQIERLSEGDGTYSKMLKFLERRNQIGDRPAPSIQSPCTRRGWLRRRRMLSG